MTDPMSELTGAQLASQIRHANYDPDYLVGYFVTLVGHIADDDWPGGKDGKTVAREALERVANFENAATDMPWVVRKR